MVESSDKRKQIKENLIKMADDLVAKFDTLKLIMEDKELEYFSRPIDDNPLARLERSIGIAQEDPSTVGGSEASSS